jgi:putative Mn2+ efflux pump MntP
MKGRSPLPSKKNENSDEEAYKRISNKALFGLGVATSIDALAVGISLALLNTPLFTLSLTIGVVTFLISVSGVYFGHHFRKKANLRFDLIGGIILVGIGVKILIEHLFLNG